MARGWGPALHSSDAPAGRCCWHHSPPRACVADQDVDGMAKVQGPLRPVPDGRQVCQVQRRHLHAAALPRRRPRHQLPAQWGAGCSGRAQGPPSRRARRASAACCRPQHNPKPPSLEPCACRLCLRLIAAAQHDPEALLQQGLCGLETDAGVAAGDQGHFVVVLRVGWAVGGAGLNEAGAECRARCLLGSWRGRAR